MAKKKASALRRIVRGSTAEAAVDRGVPGALATLSPSGYHRPKAAPGERREAQTFAALVHAVWLAFAADEDLEAVEVDHLVGLIDGLTEGEAPADVIEELFNAYAEMYRELGPEGSARAIAVVLKDAPMREAAFRLAYGAVLLDGEVTREEEGVLETLATAFGFTPAEAAALVKQAESELDPPVSTVRGA